MSSAWQAGGPGLYWREDETGTVAGYYLRDGLPSGYDGNPSPRLPSNWRAHVRAGVRWWWRIDGAEEEWRPAGLDHEASVEHVEAHMRAVALSVTDHAPGPCEVCARINAAAHRSEAA